MAGVGVFSYNVPSQAKAPKARMSPPIIIRPIAILYSTPNFPLTKSFNVKTNNPSMVFKIKAWQIYLISVFVLSVPLVMVLGNYGYGTGEGLGYDIGSMVFTSAIIGGAILAVYYGYKREQRKKRAKP